MKILISLKNNMNPFWGFWPRKIILHISYKSTLYGNEDSIVHRLNFSSSFLWNALSNFVFHEIICIVIVGWSSKAVPLRNRRDTHVTATLTTLFVNGVEAAWTRNQISVGLGINHFLFFIFVWYRFWTAGLLLARQVLYHLSHAPNPFCLTLFFR
jgi:hypothetical protein